MPVPRQYRRLRCEPPTTLRFGSYQTLLDSLRRPKGPRNLDVDLRKLRWIEALPIAILTAHVRHHLHHHPDTVNTIFIPDKYAYLQRMDFFRVVGVRLPETFQRRDPTGRFVPVRALASGSEVPTVAAEIVDTLRVDDNDAASVLRHCIGEIVDNVFVHSRASTGAFVCAQHFPNANRSQVGIVDTGIGFRESFEESAAFDSYRLDDQSALQLAMAPYVTSKPRTGAPYETSYGRLGVGLFIVSELLAAVGGRLLVASSSACLDKRWNRRKWSRVRPWHGAIVGFEVPDEPMVEYQVALKRARQLASDLARKRSV